MCLKLRIHIPDEQMMRLIERVVLTKTNRGLRQGGNLSPLFLNVHLNHFLDGKWRRQHPDNPLLRWADDLLIQCRDQEEARQAYQDLKRLLEPTGMTLKGTLEQTIHNLHDGAYADWLGYRLLKGENGLVVHLTETAWKSLAEKLEQDHEKNCSPFGLSKPSGDGSTSWDPASRVQTSPGSPRGSSHWPVARLSTRRHPWSRYAGNGDPRPGDGNTFGREWPIVTRCEQNGGSACRVATGRPRPVRWGVHADAPPFLALNIPFHHAQDLEVEQGH
jgi:hypothetical protein